MSAINEQEASDDENDSSSFSADDDGEDEGNITEIIEEHSNNATAAGLPSAQNTQATGLSSEGIGMRLLKSVLGVQGSNLLVPRVNINAECNAAATAALRSYSHKHAARDSVTKSYSSEDDINLDSVTALVNKSLQSGPPKRSFSPAQSPRMKKKKSLNGRDACSEDNEPLSVEDDPLEGPSWLYSPEATRNRFKPRRKTKDRSEKISMSHTRESLVGETDGLPQRGWVHPTEDDATATVPVADGVNSLDLSHLDSVDRNASAVTYENIPDNSDPGIICRPRRGNQLTVAARESDTDSRFSNFVPEIAASEDAAMSFVDADALPNVRRSVARRGRGRKSSVSFSHMVQVLEDETEGKYHAFRTRSQFKDKVPEEEGAVDTSLVSKRSTSVLRNKDRSTRMKSKPHTSEDRVSDDSDLQLILDESNNSENTEDSVVAGNSSSKAQDKKPEVEVIVEVQNFSGNYERSDECNMAAHNSNDDTIQTTNKMLRRFEELDKMCPRRNRRRTKPNSGVDADEETASELSDGSSNLQEIFAEKSDILDKEEAVENLSEPPSKKEKENISCENGSLPFLLPFPKSSSDAINSDNRAQVAAGESDLELAHLPEFVANETCLDEEPMELTLAVPAGPSSTISCEQRSKCKKTKSKTSSLADEESVETDTNSGQGNAETQLKPKRCPRSKKGTLTTGDASLTSKKIPDSRSEFDLSQMEATVLNIAPYSSTRKLKTSESEKSQLSRLSIEKPDKRVSIVLVDVCKDGVPIPQLVEAESDEKNVSTTAISKLTRSKRSKRLCYSEEDLSETDNEDGNDQVLATVESQSSNRGRRRGYKSKRIDGVADSTEKSGRALVSNSACTKKSLRNSQSYDGSSQKDAVATRESDEDSDFVNTPPKRNKVLSPVLPKVSADEEDTDVSSNADVNASSAKISAGTSSVVKNSPLSLTRRKKVSSAGSSEINGTRSDRVSRSQITDSDSSFCVDLVDINELCDANEADPESQEEEMFNMLKRKRAKNRDVSSSSDEFEESGGESARNGTDHAGKRKLDASTAFRNNAGGKFSFSKLTTCKVMKLVTNECSSKVNSEIERSGDQDDNGQKAEEDPLLVLSPLEASETDEEKRDEVYSPIVNSDDGIDNAICDGGEGKTDDVNENNDYSDGGGKRKVNIRAKGDGVKANVGRKTVCVDVAQSEKGVDDASGKRESVDDDDCKGNDVGVDGGAENGGDSSGAENGGGGSGAENGGGGSGAENGGGGSGAENGGGGNGSENGVGGGKRTSNGGAIVFPTASHPRRAATKAVSYAEPKLNSKLRQGDPLATKLPRNGSSEASCAQDVPKQKGPKRPKLIRR
ncbi:uncharacterized protein LOC108677811 [Hyalella azteca]|uniref:Uncharacterized protein LOC108677811 n=1 Tax=Hyalella azteca TaxID=294128 RepID=A0A8B7P8T8_HYAAZ|nr:uncharacterized protein LOC108677811 [Hyalella azteca]